VQTLNLVLKNICAAKSNKKDSDTYQECSWITQIVDDVTYIESFIVDTL